jgi:hypothetical protein
LITSLFFGQETYIHLGKLIDTKNDKVLSNKTIIVSNKTISSVAEGFLNPITTNSKVID